MTNNKRAYLITNTVNNTVQVAHDKATIAELLGTTRQCIQALLTGEEAYHKKSKSTIKSVLIHKKLTNRVGRASNFDGKKSI